MGMLPPVCAQAYTYHNKKILEASRELVSLNFAAAAAKLCVGARVMNWLMRRLLVVEQGPSGILRHSMEL